MTTTTSVHPSARVSLLGFSEIVRIRNRVLEMIGRGQRVLRLEGGEPFMPTPAFIKQAMKDALDANETRYAPSSGTAPLLEAIRTKLAAKNHLAVETSSLIVTSGGAHGLFCAFQASVDPGDEVILFSPYWTPIRDHIAYSGATPVRVPWDELAGKDIRDVLAPRITEKTRLIYVNTPSNPTGCVLSGEQLRGIADLAVAHDLAVVSDEAYEDLVYEGEHISLATFPGMTERTISVFTLSKSFAMTGWRVGYIVAPERFMAPIRKLVLNSINGVSTPSQAAAAAAITHGGEFIAEARAEYRKRRDLLVPALERAGFRIAPPRGAFYLFADVRERLGGDSWKAMETLLSRTSIASVPGVVFGQEGEGHLRMSLSVTMNVVEEAMEALGKL
jgi:aspartate aminotransferase